MTFPNHETTIYTQAWSLTWVVFLPHVLCTPSHPQLNQAEQKMEQDKREHQQRTEQTMDGHKHKREHKKEDENCEMAKNGITDVSFPWKQGYYLGKGSISDLKIIGNRGILRKDWMTITFNSGDFGEADPAVALASGGSRYTVEMKIKAADKEQVTPMVLTDDGKVFYFKSKIKTIPIESLRWVTEEEALKAGKEGDNILAPPSDYKLEPERRGKLVWITGAPGMGKSTTAQLLSRKHGFVFYEGDCFWSLKNPYIPPEVPEASLAQLDQKKLVGEGAEERQEMSNKVNKAFLNMFDGKEYEERVIEEGFRMMCANIR